VVGWDKDDFCGRTALEKERDEGPVRRLRGILAEGRQPPRHGDDVLVGGRSVGRVTSGNYSPMRRRGIALALVETSAGLADGEVVAVSVRGRDLPARLAPTRFLPPPAQAAS
jgi:aminomethyltransferase